MYPTDAVTIFDLKVREAQKERERIAIQAILATKNQRLSTVKTASATQLDEAAEAMYEKTNVILPQSLKYGLEGAAAKSATASLKAMPRPNFATPVKRG